MPNAVPSPITLRSRYLGIVLVLLLLELLVATDLARHRFIRGSLGDFLVAILLYFLLQAICRLSSLKATIAVFAFSCLVEGAQSFHPAPRLGFEPGDLLSILLGNTFSWMDIGMYGAGCATALLLDLQLLDAEGDLSGQQRDACRQKPGAPSRRPPRAVDDTLRLSPPSGTRPIKVLPRPQQVQAGEHS